MKNYEEILRKVPLFGGICDAERDQMLTCLEARQQRYAAGEIILLAGQPVEVIGILLAGRAQVIREDFSGSRTILTELVPGEMFAEAFVCAGVKALPVTVLSVSECSVLTIDYRRMIQTCPSSCPFHAQMIQNMLAVLANKNLLLNRRMGHLSKRTTREKLLSYLLEQAAAQGSDTFTIPFSRQELADYLCVERSAMSAVLGKLREEGVLSFHRNHFTLHIP